MPTQQQPDNLSVITHLRNSNLATYQCLLTNSVIICQPINYYIPTQQQSEHYNLLHTHSATICQHINYYTPTLH